MDNLNKKELLSEEQSADGYTPQIGDLEPAPPPEPPEESSPLEEDPPAETSDTEDMEDAENETEPEQPAGSSSPVPDASLMPPIDMGPQAASLAEAAAGPEAIMAPQESRFRRVWRERKLFIILSTLFLLLAIAAISAIAYVYFVIHPFESYDKILPNVYCAGVNLGGMTKDEAQGAIEEALRYPSYSVKVILPDCEYLFQPEQEGVTLNGAQVAQRAYNYGRADTSAYGIYKAYQSAKRTEYRLDAETDLVYSQEDIQALAQQITQETYIAPTESTARHDQENHTAYVTLGVPGRIVETETIVDAVDRAFEDMIFKDITLEYEKVEIDLAALRSLVSQCRTEYSSDPIDPAITANAEAHAIDLTTGIQGWKLNSNDLYEVARAAVEDETYGEVSLALEPVEPADIDITAAYQELACDPTEPYYYGGVVYESTNGYTLDWEAAINQIMECTYGQSISIPMTVIAPKRTAAEVEAVLFRDQLSSYSTPHTSNSNRTHNLALACQAINGTVINAGETFSFNDVVGERTSSKGYRSATVYVGNESKEETGGGICQVASTIYDAALYAEMEITSRAAHTFFVTYVPGGLDATIYWGSLDFCFRNSTEFPIRVNAWVSGGSVHISIDGTKTNDHVVKLSSTKLSTTPYSTVYEEDSSKPAGYRKETTYPYTGYTYEAYQYIYDGDGNLLETNYLGKSTYKKRDQVITIGTG